MGIVAFDHLHSCVDRHHMYCMSVVRQYSDMVREYPEPMLCEAGVAYKHLDSVHDSKSEKANVLRAALRKFQNLCGRLGHPDIRDHPLEWDKTYCVECGKECYKSQRTSDFPRHVEVYPSAGPRFA
jgi:hypothetical protein